MRERERGGGGRKSTRITRGMNGKRDHLDRVARMRIYKPSDARPRRRGQAFTSRPVYMSLSLSSISHLSVCPSVRSRSCAPALSSALRRVLGGASSRAHRVECTVPTVFVSSRVRASRRVKGEGVRFSLRINEDKRDISPDLGGPGTKVPVDTVNTAGSRLASLHLATSRPAHSIEPRSRVVLHLLHSTTPTVRNGRAGARVKDRRD